MKFDSNYGDRGARYEYNEYVYNDSIDKKISIRLVIGAGVEFWKLGLDVRFETGFVRLKTTEITSFTSFEDVKRIANVLDGALQKPNQLIVGLSYKF